MASPSDRLFVRTFLVVRAGDARAVRGGMTEPVESEVAR